jgi:signal transduction histidine kinase
MAIDADHHRAESTHRELVLFLVAALAVVTVLTLVLAERGGESMAAMGRSQLLLGVLVAGVTLAGSAVAVLVIGRMRRALRAAEAEANTLRRDLATAEAITHAEPQSLVLWEQGQEVKIVAHSLVSVPGLPSDGADLLRFGSWLDAASADELKAGLDALFTTGRPFGLLLKTSAGGYVEADGRTTGPRAVLRLRDVASHKRELVRIVDQHRTLAARIDTAHQLLDTLPMPVWSRTSDGRLDWVNSAYVKAVEAASVPEVLDRQLELLESRQRATVATQLASGQTFSERLPLISGGLRHPFDVVVVPRAGHSTGIAMDATAVEAARGDLDRETTAFDSTLRRVATPVAIFGPDQGLTFFNEAYTKLWQLDPAWLETGPSDSQILDRLRQTSKLPAVVDYRQWRARVLSCYETGKDFEDWWHLPDGQIVHVFAEQRPDGGVTYLYDDATERFALESRYNALIDVQRETLDSLSEGVAVFATDGRLQLYNNAFMTIWKFARSTLAASPHVDTVIQQARTLHDDTEQWAEITASVTSISDERAPISGQMVRPDQSVIDYAVSPLPDGATLVTFADVTDNKRYERALIERNEALVAADKLKSQFISHVSYELRTPLTNIIGFSELLTSPRTGPLNQKQKEYLTDITGSSRTLLAIIDDILDLATIDAGSLELKLAPVKVRAITDAAILAVRDRASRAQLTIEVSIEPDAVELIADEARVRQILYNLLSNAIGFSRPGEKIDLACWSEGAYIGFAVRDQGVGIPKEQLGRIFDRFESRSQGSRHRGAGLGLSIVKSLVELHGGDMTVDSEPGKGTRVMVRLPRSGSKPAGTETDVARRRA